VVAAAESALSATNIVPRIFVGWDSREDIAWQVCRTSLLRNASAPIEVRALRQGRLRSEGLYRKPLDPLASTEFTYTRFLVPHVAGYRDWALFCDCDFIWLSDVMRLFALADDRYAVMCVHHDHRPTETLKMDGAVQTQYPRKNWSSMVLFNCGHPANRALTPEVVDREGGAFLHRFQWLDDALIGSVPETWNWLEGWNRKPAQGRPDVVHYTRGGPWFPNWRDVDYAAEWLEEAARYQTEGGAEMWGVFDFWQEDAHVTPRNELRARFHGLHARALEGDLAPWRATAQGRIAELLILAEWGVHLAAHATAAAAGRALARGLARDAHGLGLRLTAAERAVLARASAFKTVPVA
jgi:hypothetical protein